MVSLTTESRLLDELRRALEEILPTDRRWRLRIPDGPTEADAPLDLTDSRSDTTRLRVELKSRLSPSEIVRQLGWYWERGPWLLAAPRVGQRARQILADEGISWIELETREHWAPMPFCWVTFSTAARLSSR